MKLTYASVILQVFVNPKSGKGNGQNIWRTVAPIFSRAKVRAQVCLVICLYTATCSIIYGKL